MTNRFYNNSLTPALGQLIQSAAVRAQLDAITSGMLLIQAELDNLQGISGITSLEGFPASFSGAAGQYAVVNTAESAIEFVSGGRLTIKSIGGTTYTLLASDAGKLLIFTNASAITVTVPPDVMTQGDVVCIRQGAAGQVTLSAGSGVTFASTDDLLATRKQAAQIAVIADGANAFGVIGERNAPSLGVALLADANVFTKAQTVTPVTLTDAATIATDASLSNTFTVTLGGNRTLGNPTNMANGAIYNWRVKQDGTGSRTLAYGSKFKWPGGTAPTLTTTASATDFISGQYWSDTDTILCTYLKAFA
jgi:hypothetical protein